MIVSIEYMIVLTRSIPTIFKKKPARDIWGIETMPLPKIIALGGVATGNIKAQLAAIAAGIISNSGLMSNPRETA